MNWTSSTNGNSVLISTAYFRGSIVAAYLIVCTATAFALPANPAPTARGLYVTNLTYTGSTDQLIRADVNGSGAQVIVNTGSAPLDVEVFEDQLYWVENNTYRIRRAGIDGSNVETIYQHIPTTFAMMPTGLAIDPVERRVYWASQQTDDIRSVGLDGADPQILNIAGIGEPYAVAIDVAGRQLFWTEAFRKQIFRSNLDGTNPQLIIQDAGNLPTLFGLTIDPVDQKIYWTNRELDRIRRANYDGSQVETIASGPSGTTFRDLEIDPISRKLYWVDDHKDAMELSYILRANLDGSGRETIAIFVGQTVGIAIGVPEPSTIALAGLGLAIFRRRNWRRSTRFRTIHLPMQ